MSNSIGPILRDWRKQRRFSQLQLALELDISSKHISFLETGRSIPSRDMLIRIGEFLFLPKREINRGLFSAGYAPVYSELSLTHDDLVPVNSAIDQMITNHMPYPAIVLNHEWDIVNSNDSAQSLLMNLGFAGKNNILEALIADDPNNSKIINWHESVSVVLLRLRYEISMLGGSKRLETFEKKLLTQFSATNNTLNIDDNPVIMSTKFQLDDCVLSFFSIISQLGSIQDVTVSEFKIELMFPSDEITKHYYLQ